MTLLNQGHYSHEDYFQIIKVKEWKEYYDQRGDKILFHGFVRILKTEKLPHGYLKVYKMPFKESEIILDNEMLSKH